MNALFHPLAGLVAQSPSHSLTLALVHSLGWTLLHFVWQGALVAALLWLALGLLPAQLSRTRYAAALCALALMAALPLATFSHLAVRDLAASRALALAPISIDSNFVIRVTPTNAPEPLLPRIQRALDDSVPWLPALWLAGVVLFLARLNLGLLIARGMANSAALTPPAELQRIFDSLRTRLRISRPVRLMHSAIVQVPTVIGWLRPVVLVPIGCLAGMSAIQVEAILAHELGHIRRHDYLVSILQSLIEAFLFYQPAVWWVSRQLRRERKNCCDDLAVAIAGDPLAYARALSSLEERRALMPSLALAASGGALTSRIRRLLGYPDDRVALQPVAITMLVVAVLASASYLIATAHAQPASRASGNTAQPLPLEDAAVSLPAIPLLTPTPFASISAAVPSSQASDPADSSAALPNQYKTWLNQDVLWIITPEERAAFLKLANNEERDGFIENFWLWRNPTPGSPENSFREEHYARIAYANQHFASGSQPGWKTDRGRAYIVYGKPESIDVHPANSPSYEVWHYPSIPGLGSSIDLKFVDDDCHCNNYRLMSQSAPDAASLAQAAQEYRLFLATYPNAPEAAEARKRLAIIQAALPAGEHSDFSRHATSNILPDDFAPESQKSLAYTHAANETVRARVEWAFPRGGRELSTYLRKVQSDLVTSSGDQQPGQTAPANTIAQAVPPTNPAAPQSPDSTTPSPATDAPTRVPSGALAGNLISKVDPVYPPEAKAAHVQGAVLLSAIISKTGTVESLRVISGVPMLNSSAVEAVQQWRYKPYIVDGQPVEVRSTVTVNFALADTPADRHAAAVPPSSDLTMVVSSTAADGAVADAQASQRKLDLVVAEARQHAMLALLAANLRKVGGPVSAPQLLYSVEPKFSEDARKAKVAGTVLLSLIVDENGLPQNVHVIRGIEIGPDGKSNPTLTDEARAAAATLDQNAVDAVNKYKFKPAMEADKPVPVLLNVEVNFKLF
jgi:TonB family protein